MPGGTSFLRYQYPSTIPPAVADRMVELSRRVMRQIGYDDTTFNVEYFWDAERDALTLLEINPRHSQSHAELFAWVDGVANHHHMVELALGRDPRPPHREGPYAVAAKWFVRRSADGVVRRVPTAEEIARVERAVDGCVVEVTVEPGERLSQRHDQDSYSYAIANVYVGGASEDDLVRKYEQAVAALPFEIDDLEDTEDRERTTDLHEDRRPLSARGRRGARLWIPMSDGIHLAGRVWRPATPASGPCRPSWSSSRTGSAT